MTQPDTALLLYCSGCHRAKPRGWFRRSGAGRRSSWCRECRKGVDSAHAARRRGAGVLPVPRDWLSRLWRSQRGLCAASVCVMPTRRLVWLAWHVDHVRSIARGGRHEYGNLALTHPACNQKKGAT